MQVSLNLLVQEVVTFIIEATVLYPPSR